VYKAEETCLGRAVAIKFLPENVSQDREALKRFHREARSASALNYPNICTLYDIGEENGLPFIVMEYLQGQTLRQRIAGKSVPTDELLTLAIHVADALDAAHRKEIIYRDINPGNVFLTESGGVKLLDFALAKMAIRAPLEGDACTELHTAAGAVGGTVQYMSPEQALGEPLDQRRDLFSLGSVLYEMATPIPYGSNTGGEPPIVEYRFHAPQTSPCPRATLPPLGFIARKVTTLHLVGRLLNKGNYTTRTESR